MPSFQASACAVDRLFNMLQGSHSCVDTDTGMSLVERCTTVDNCFQQLCTAQQVKFHYGHSTLPSSGDVSIFEAYIRSTYSVLASCP